MNRICYLTMARIGLFTLCIGFLPSLNHATASAKDLHDAPEHRARSETDHSSPANYQEALKKWRGLEDLNQWIGHNFKYDMKRAVGLSESKRAKSGRSRIYTPDELFANPHGVCVDLARFAVESAKTIKPTSEPRYLMINFEPITIQGETLRRHWMMVFTRSSQHYSMADSKRPGHIDGPYGSINELVDQYAKFRARKVVSFKVLTTWEKGHRKRKLKRIREESNLYLKQTHITIASSTG